MDLQKPLHEALKPISWLAGKWISDNGVGFYPTIKEFEYNDIMEFTSVGQPMLNFTSHSTHRVKKTPMHQERGFLRIKPGTNELSFIISHNFGLTSIEEGTVENNKILLKSTNISRMSFAKEPSVKYYERTFILNDDNSLDVTFSMETDRTKLTQHLKATYIKESE